MEQWAAEHPDALTRLELDFLDACQQGRERAKKDAEVGQLVITLFLLAMSLSKRLAEEVDRQVEARVAEIRRSGTRVGEAAVHHPAGPPAPPPPPPQETPPDAVPEYESLGPAALPRVKWETGTVLRVRFLDGDPVVQAKVAAAAREWTRYANLEFAFGDDPAAEVRVSFRDAGSWSYLGTDALRIPPNLLTMNYGWLTPDTDDDEVMRVVLHTFGHALGLNHEHQNPASRIRWNVPVVMKYYSDPPNNWSPEEVVRNLFARFSEEGSLYHEFDPDSIMMYPIPAGFTLDGLAVGLNRVLSATDKAFIAEVYPVAPVTVLAVGGPASRVPAVPLRLHWFGFRVAVAGPYEVTVDGPAGVEVGLRGPDPGDAPALTPRPAGKAGAPRFGADLRAGKYQFKVWFAEAAPGATLRVGVAAPRPAPPGKAGATGDE